MPGRIFAMIEKIISERSAGSSIVASTTRTKLILKGVDPQKFTATSPDDPAIIEKLKVIAGEMGVKLN